MRSVRSRAKRDVTDATSAKEPFIIRGNAVIGGFRTSGNMADAISAFGGEYSARNIRGRLRSCLVRWPRLELSMVFTGNGCKGNSSFVRSAATGARWKTYRGLQIGASVAALKRTYPGAARGAKDVWILLRRQSKSTLLARMHDGRVSSFVVSSYRDVIRW